MVAVFYMSRLFTVEASEPENKLKIIHGAVKYSTMTVVINTAVPIWKLLGENLKSSHLKERKICNYGGGDRC